MKKIISCLIACIFLSIYCTEDINNSGGSGNTVLNYQIINVPANNLDSSILDIPDQQPATIIFPQNYNDGSGRRYPVIYYLHGASGSNLNILDYSEAIINYFQSNENQFIIVGVNCSSNIGGCFYVNSTVAGNWETQIIEELVPYIDANYRTIADVNSRGIAGSSMGGFGSIYLGFRHPDIFSCIYSISPGLLDNDDLSTALNLWTGYNSFLCAYAGVFSPNISNPPYYGNILTLSDINNDTQVEQDWLNGFGNLQDKIDDYKANVQAGSSLNAILIEYGTYDYYTWIPRGCTYFSTLLQANGFVLDDDYSINEFSGGHGGSNQRYSDYMLPFFSDNLDFGTVIE